MHDKISVNYHSLTVPRLSLLTITNTLSLSSILEQLHSLFHLISPPLREAVELGPRHLEDELKVRVGEVALQVAAVHVIGQAVVGDHEQVDGVDLGRLRQRVRHVRQGPDKWGYRVQHTRQIV